MPHIDWTDVAYVAHERVNDRGPFLYNAAGALVRKTSARIPVDRKARSGVGAVKVFEGVRSIHATLLVLVLREEGRLEVTRLSLAQVVQIDLTDCGRKHSLSSQHQNCVADPF